MATVNVRQELDVTALNHQLYSSSGGFARDMLRRGLRVQARARRKAPAYTGRLRVSIQVASEPRIIGGVSTFGITVGTNLNYAKWVHDGTGLYGPHHTPIVPKGKILVFVSRKPQRAAGRSKRGKVVRVSQVAGQHPVPFLKDALSAARGRAGSAIS